MYVWYLWHPRCEVGAFLHDIWKCGRIFDRFTIFLQGCFVIYDKEGRLGRKEDSVYSDLGLIRKMKQGDDAAFDTFVHQYYEKVLLYCRYHCMDKEYAQDLTQETFVRFFMSLPTYHYRGKNLNFLYTIAGNLCKDYLKKRKELPLQENQIAGENSGEEQQMEDVVNKILVEQAMEHLSEELKEMIFLYYFKGLKLAEIAETLQIGLPLVKYRLKRAKKQLEEWVVKGEEL